MDIRRKVPAVDKKIRVTCSLGSIHILYLLSNGYYRYWLTKEPFTGLVSDWEYYDGATCGNCGGPIMPASKVEDKGKCIKCHYVR